MSDLRFTSHAKPPHINGAYDDFSDQDLLWIATQFDIPAPDSVAPFPHRGNINLHTYEVISGNCRYLLQKVNSEVFTRPHSVMKAMVASIQAQRKAMALRHVPGWHHIDLVPTLDGKEYLDLTDEHGRSVWRLMLRIPDSVSFKSLGELPYRAAQLDIACEVGRGLAIYTDLCSSIDPKTVETSLPGYRDTGLYYRMFHSIVAGNRSLAEAAPYLPDDPIRRASTEKHFLVALDERRADERKADPQVARAIETAIEYESFAMSLWSALALEEIESTLIHGDPKIENFLFDVHTGRVKALVDLDTIMSFTWLSDWGDMIRSMVNVAGEKETDLDKVVIDEEVFGAVAKGFLSAFRDLTDRERSLMMPACQVMTLELGLRFLTDWLRGDTYYRLVPSDPPDLNRTRALVQFRLFERMLEFSPRAEAALALSSGP